VARLAAALAADRGIRTIDITPAPMLADHIRKSTGGEGLAALLDSVGGQLVSELLPTLRQGATIVSYGTLAPEPASVPNAAIVYSNLTWRGFGIDLWLEQLPPAEHARMVEELWQAIRAGHLPLPVSRRVELARFADAFATSTGSGKVLLV
jgi:NADPH:quinone reductase-like Zn-dependent oxidoreductase